MYITITDDRVGRRPGESIERTLVLSVDDEGRDAVLRFVKWVTENRYPFTEEGAVAAMATRPPGKIGDPITDEEWSNQHPARRAMIKQTIVTARPNDSINVEDVPGNEIIMSGGTVVLVLAGDTAPDDHNVIVGAIFKLLAICAGTGIDALSDADAVIEAERILIRQRADTQCFMQDHIGVIEELRRQLAMCSDAAKKSKTPVTVEEHRNRIIDMRSDLELAEHTFLEQRGWAYTSRFPDHMYRWIKKFDDGPTLAVDRQTALSIEGVPA